MKRSQRNLPFTLLINSVFISAISACLLLSSPEVEAQAGWEGYDQGQIAGQGGFAQNNQQQNGQIGQSNNFQQDFQQNYPQSQSQFGDYQNQYQYQQQYHQPYQAAPQNQTLPNYGYNNGMTGNQSGAYGDQVFYGQAQQTQNNGLWNQGNQTTGADSAQMAHPGAFLQEQSPESGMSGNSLQNSNLAKDLEAQLNASRTNNDNADGGGKIGDAVGGIGKFIGKAAQVAAPAAGVYMLSRAARGGRVVYSNPNPMMGGMPMNPYAMNPYGMGGFPMMPGMGMGMPGMGMGMPGMGMPGMGMPGAGMRGIFGF